MKQPISFNRRTAYRIALISTVLALLASQLTWFLATENAEEEIIALAMEESRRVLDHWDGKHTELAQQAAKSLTGGLFDIAEIYTLEGQKLAESLTPHGETIEDKLPKHGRPTYTSASYESLHLSPSLWVLRVFVPIKTRESEAITGYFEGVRVVPEWQKDQIWQDAFALALVVALSSLLCGGVIYPVVVHLSRDNERKAREVLESHISIMEAMGRAIAKRDSDTGSHNYRVAWLAAMIGEKLGLQGKSMQSLILGSFLHDVGKIGIPDAILLKPGKLDDAEMDIMRTHVTLGGEIVVEIPWLKDAADVVMAHHEKWDGTGYPQKLAGEAIPQGARIFAIADVFDALCSKRPYKDPMPLEKAVRILAEETGRHFDPFITPIFLDMAPALHQALEGADETRCKTMLKEKIAAHFGF